MPAISALTTPTLTTWSQGDTITAALLNGNNSALQTGVINLNSAIGDVEENYASASAPTDKPQGKLWYDSGNSVLKLYHTLNATAPASLLDSTSAYNQALSTAGTATFKLAGKVNVDYTQVSRAGATGALMTYTVPGGTLNASGVAMQSICFGTKSGASSAASLQPRLAGTALTTHTMSAACTDWYIENWIVRRASATLQAMGSFMMLNRDDTASTTLCDTTTSGATAIGMATAAVFDINVSAIGALDTITQEVMINIIWH